MSTFFRCCVFLSPHDVGDIAGRTGPRGIIVPRPAGRRSLRSSNITCEIICVMYADVAVGMTPVTCLNSGDLSGQVLRSTDLFSNKRGGRQRPLHSVR